jgi:hypothetical protein
MGEGTRGDDFGGVPSCVMDAATYGRKKKCPLPPNGIIMEGATGSQGQVRGTWA